MKITAKRLRQLLHYDPQTGLFRWRVGRPGFRRDMDGQTAGYRESVGGRISVTVEYGVYRAHRLAWLYMTGRWPIGEIDHKDGDASNNRWTNLREVSRGVNQQNMRRPHKDNAAGFLGVVQRGDRFRASICVNRKRHYLGAYETPEAAHAAYVRGKRRLHEGCTL